MIRMTAKATLFLLSLVALLGSAAYWWGVQRQLTDNLVVAGAFTVVLVLAAPSLMAFAIPWTPAGMLFQRITAKTWGYGVILASAFFLVYYSFDVQYSWWLAQSGVGQQMVFQQVGVGIIGFILIPALLWSSVSPDELAAQIRQERLVKRHEMQTQADLAILRIMLLRAQRHALTGLLQLTAAEKTELTDMLVALDHGIDSTLAAIGESAAILSDTTMGFEQYTHDGEDIRRYLGYVGDTLLSLVGQDADPPEDNPAA